jgi:hypothetical protein
MKIYLIDKNKMKIQEVVMLARQNSAEKATQILSKAQPGLMND